MSLGSFETRVLEIVSPIADKMPLYHPDAADINEALDYGVASCAVRAYAAGLLLRDAYPNEGLYTINFGFSPEHGGVYKGKNGNYVRMGHAVTRFWVPEQRPLIVESYNDSKMEITAVEDAHEDFLWWELNEGYKEYLERAGLEDVLVDPQEVLCFLKGEVFQPETTATN